MSGPVTPADLEAERGGSDAAGVPLEVTKSREGTVGTFRVRRALPRRRRRSVGPWCFVDHMGPGDVTEDRGLGVAPHPHIGLQTVTWLLEGQALHRDSLGTEQVIAPGKLNLMTAGHGVAHSEEGTGRYRGAVHGVQLWVAQPSATSDGPAAFEHHPTLPQRELDGAVATVLVGDFDGQASPARRDTDHVGVDLSLHGHRSVVPLQAGFEHALVVCTGAVRVDDRIIEPGHLAYLGSGRDDLALATQATTRALLIGGVPFDEPLVMWWNFVARTQEEISAAYDAWANTSDRFGEVASPLPRIDVGPPPWRSSQQ